MINWSRYKPKALPTLRFPRWGNFMKRLRNWIWPWPCLFHKHRNGWITWLRWSLIQVTRNWPERQWTWRIPLVKRFVNLRHLPEGQWIWEWYWTKKCVFSLRRMMANEWGDRSGANLGIHNVQGLVFFFFLGVRRADEHCRNLSRYLIFHFEWLVTHADSKSNQWSQLLKSPSSKS